MRPLAVLVEIVRQPYHGNGARHEYGGVVASLGKAGFGVHRPLLSPGAEPCLILAIPHPCGERDRRRKRHCHNIRVDVDDLAGVAANRDELADMPVVRVARDHLIGVRQVGVRIIAVARRGGGCGAGNIGKAIGIRDRGREVDPVVADYQPLALSAVGQDPDAIGSGA